MDTDHSRVLIGMPKSSLRYPGGKTRAIPILRRYLETEYPSRKTMLSPFLGGGSFELDCVSRGYDVHANDLFRPLLTFWTVAQESPEALRTRIRQECPVSKDRFLQFRESILSMTDPLDIAVAYFIVNRCSFSGATFCGGFSAEAAEKRCNSSAIDRIVQPGFRSLSNLDAIAFLQAHPETDSTVIYADPPYFIDTYIYGKNGDMHEGFDHQSFANYIRTRRDWILSYNDCPYIRELYAGCRIHTENWSYGMNAAKPSSEIIILPPL